MDRETSKNILIKDGYTQDEAEDILSKDFWMPGACIIYESISDYINVLRESGTYDNETEEDIKSGCFAHVHVVEYENNDYCIEYVV